MKNMTRTRLIQIWFAAITLISVGAIALGLTITVTTGAILLALCLIPAAIVLLLWPGVQPRTAADVLYDRSST